MKVVRREETAGKYPAIFKIGIVALVTAVKGKGVYQYGGRADRSKTKAVRVPFTTPDQIQA